MSIQFSIRGGRDSSSSAVAARPLARFGAFFASTFFLGCVALQAQHCGSVRILSPANEAEYSSVPLPVSVSTSGVSCFSGFHVSLDGADITRLFGPSVNGVRQAMLYHRNLKAGRNRLSARGGKRRDVVRFVFRPGSSEVPASSQPQPTFVPIQTRIISGDGTKFSDYSVQVGSNTYPAPDLNPADTDGYGFQVLVLDRDTLQPVSNISYPTDFLGEVLELDGRLKSQDLSNGCGVHGCLVIVQTFLGDGLGNAGNGLDLDGLGYIGGTTEMNNVNGNNGYSLITTVGNPNQGAPEESGYERIACSPRQAVCGAPIHGSGQISGTLVLDNNNSYTFAQPSRYTFSTGTAANSTSNTITVGSTDYPSSTLNSGGGFQLVVLDRTTLGQVLNETYAMDQLGSLGSAITSHNNINYLFVLSSIGTVARPSTPSGLISWYALASALTQIGGTYTVFDHLAAGDDYSLVGAYSSPSIGDTLFPGPSGFARFNVQEASSIISRAVQPTGATTPASNIHGVLRLDHEGYYAPIISNLSANFFNSTENLLDAIALQTPIAWPYPQSGHPGQAAAYTYFSQQACSCGDVRSNYANLDAPLSSYQGNITRAVYNSSLGFSETDFKTLQNQLNTELTYAIAIQSFENNLTTLFTAENSNLGLLLTNDYTTVEQNLYHPPPPPSNSTFFDVLDVSADALSFASYLEVLTPEGQLAAGAASTTLFVMEDFIHSSSGPPALNQKGQLLSTYGALASDAANNFADTEYEIGNLFDLILSDWGKLQALGLPLDQGKIAWNDALTGQILGNYDRSIRKQYLLSLMAGVFGIEHDAQVIGAGTPPTGWIFGRNPPPFGPAPDLSLPAEILLPSGPNGQTPSSGNNGQYYDAYVLWNHQRPFADAGPVNSQALTPLFAPLNFDDPSQLGQYQPWFFTRAGQIPVTCINQTTGSACGSQ